ncbi:conserved protein of unknown function [Hyphomicrobium sp. MC1]|nr:conserved protein of unknown function [Hyphomicrobium sp. MC1]
MRLRSRFGFELVDGFTRADRDCPGLLALRNVADEIYVQEAVLEFGARHIDVVGKLEAALERAGGNAAVKVGFAFGVSGLLAGDRKGLLFDLDLQLVLGEASNSERDPVGVLAGAFDVIRRVGGFAIEAYGAIERLEQAVETDSRTVKGGKFSVSHDISSMRSDM